MENRSRIVNHSGVLERVRRFILRVNSDGGKVTILGLRYIKGVTIFQPSFNPKSLQFAYYLINECEHETKKKKKKK